MQGALRLLFSSLPSSPIATLVGAIPSASHPHRFVRSLDSNITDSVDFVIIRLPIALLLKSEICIVSLSYYTRSSNLKQWWEFDTQITLRRGVVGIDEAKTAGVLCDSVLGFVIQKMPKKSSSKKSKPGLQNPSVASWDMSKKSASKPPKPALQKPALTKEKPAPTPQRYGQEIDEIFSKKRKKPEQQKTSKLNKKTSKDSKDDECVTQKKKKNKSGGSNVDMFENEQLARPRRKTADGLAIYTEEELGFGKADAGAAATLPPMLVSPIVTRHRHPRRATMVLKGIVEDIKEMTYLWVKTRSRVQFGDMGLEGKVYGSSGFSVSCGFGPFPVLPVDGSRSRKRSYEMGLHRGAFNGFCFRV
ncbi:hypothetical protein E3N88_08576 [Mikania micrantha]|uniref:Uncharacterized protein n=1 Tax=Mikania micrantha TaxID=192012 RepID=A0A5N6PGL2_9ASTR|nr:hypothetical protein E3N88_08576 [Mikania micrantha]